MLRHGIVAAATPRITRQHPFKREPEPFVGAMLADSFYAIVGASGLITATAADERRQRILIHLDEGNHQPRQATIEATDDFFEDAHDCLATWSNNSFITNSICANCGNSLPIKRNSISAWHPESAKGCRQRFLFSR